MTVAAALFAGRTAQADLITWTGSGTDATGPGAPAPDAVEVAAGEQPFRLWNAADNWNPSAIPGTNDDVTFGVPAVSGAINVAYSAPVAAHSITVNNSGHTSAYEFEAPGAGRLTLAGGGSVTLGDNVPGAAFRGPIDLSGSASFTSGATSSSFNFAGATVTGLTSGSTLTVTANSGTANAVGVVTGPISLVKSGGSALSFFGAMTYTGSTQVSGGVAISKVNNALPTATILTVGSGATAGTYRLDDGTSVTVGGLVNGGTALTNGITGNSTTLTSTVTVDATQYTRFNGRLGGTTAATQNLNFVKTGATPFTIFDQAQSYTGTTSVLGGTLEIDGIANLSNTGGITINGGRLLFNSTSAPGLGRPITAFTAGSIGGTGRINTPVTIAAGATISPGGDLDAVTGVFADTIATQNYTAGLTFAPDGTFHFDATAATGDRVNVTGALDVTATGADPFVIDVSGTGLLVGQNYQWTLASATSVAGFAADKFLVVGGSGSVSQVGNTLVLSYAVPEPGALAVVGVAGMALAMRRRRN